MSAHEAAVEVMAWALCEAMHFVVGVDVPRPCATCQGRARPQIAALAAKPEVRAALADALEASDKTAHAGSPRNISDVYCYIPVLEAVDAVLDALAGAEVKR